MKPTTAHRLLLTTLALLASCLLGHAQTYVVKVPGITTGSSTLQNYAGADGWMIVQGFAYDSSRSQTGPTTFGVAEPSGLSVFMIVDAKTMPALFQLSINGGSLGDGTFTPFTIEGIDTTTTPGTPVSTIQLGIQGVIRDFQIEGTSGDQVFVSMSIALQKLRFKTIPLKPDGTADTPFEFGWDFENGLQY